MAPGAREQIDKNNRNRQESSHREADGKILLDEVLLVPHRTLPQTPHSPYKRPPLPRRSRFVQKVILFGFAMVVNSSDGPGDLLSTSFGLNLEVRRRDFKRCAWRAIHRSGLGMLADPISEVIMA